MLIEVLLLCNEDYGSEHDEECNIDRFDPKEKEKQFDCLWLKSFFSSDKHIVLYYTESMF